MGSKIDPSNDAELSGIKLLLPINLMEDVVQECLDVGELLHKGHRKWEEASNVANVGIPGGADAGVSLLLHVKSSTVKLDGEEAGVLARVIQNLRRMRLVPGPGGFCLGFDEVHHTLRYRASELRGHGLLLRLADCFG